MLRAPDVLFPTNIVHLINMSVSNFSDPLRDCKTMRLKSQQIKFWDSGTAAGRQGGTNLSMIEIWGFQTGKSFECYFILDE